ncbi:MAG TPA: nicotinate phosphoribosyltransferase [Caldisericia bacterium]|nr:nicotinate phosphoribosyltransferase [Caldisericia bacterium]HQL66076.1 nicotinate phosphoribosyltransferase [Caldisericia bacterium]HQN48841.1 nicotinate phosphoribosyltransferase [Caldisericia bacterium]HQP00468.1 nicotinate phosphoribosyltransferase [Caldisericia bacterium]
MKIFRVPTEDEIKSGLCTDAYFVRTEEVLKGLDDKTEVTMELMTKKFPDKNYCFGVFAGVYEVAKLLEGLPVDVDSIEEGDFFYPEEPVLNITGKYTDFVRYETSILGFICSYSGIASKSIRVRIASKNKTVLSFGTRRQHPFLAPTIEYATYIAGFNGVSNVVGAKYIGKEAVGTMPHALILVLGDNRKAFKKFDEIVDSKIPRICLIDTSGSPITELEDALTVLGERLDGVRIDSGDLKTIGKEIRWLLNIKNRNDVEIFFSGGLDEYSILDLNDIGDGFGVGTKIADADVIDFALKIIEVNREPKAKYGNYPGKKTILRNDKFEDIVTLHRNNKDGYRNLLKPLIRNGKIVREFEDVDEIRNRVLSNIDKLPDYLKSIVGEIKYPVKLIPNLI